MKVVQAVSVGEVQAERVVGERPVGRDVDLVQKCGDLDDRVAILRRALSGAVGVEGVKEWGVLRCGEE